MSTETVKPTSAFPVKKLILLLLAVAVFLFFWFVPRSFFGIAADGTPILTVIQQRTVAIFALAALMWMFEVLPTWATSVTIIVLLLFTISDSCPLFLRGSQVEPAALGTFVSYKAILAAFADPTIMLFLGGFILAIAATKVGLDVQLARVLLIPFGNKPKYVLLGFLLVIGLFSMFMSNTATAAMMLTFLAPVLKTLPADERGTAGLALAIPIAANLGGIGTPIGTPPNAIALGALENAGYTISFVDWMSRMVPYVIVMIAIAWVLLQLFFPFKSDRIELKIESKAGKKDWRTYVAWITFFVTILLWVTESLTGINSNIVALIPLAVYTCTGVFSKEEIKEINWSVLWLVAGGFALGTGLNKTGLAATLINAIPFSTMDVVLVMIIAGFICYFLSNFISNSATAALLVPILVVVGTAMSDPSAANNAQFVSLGGMYAMIPFIAMCASIAMLFPISTPPNAIAASTGLVQTKDMAKVGIIIGVIGFVLGYFLLTKIFPFTV